MKSHLKLPVYGVEAAEKKTDRRMYQYPGEEAVGSKTAWAGELGRNMSKKY